GVPPAGPGPARGGPGPAPPVRSPPPRPRAARRAARRSPAPPRPDRARREGLDRRARLRRPPRGPDRVLAAGASSRDPRQAFGPQGSLARDEGDERARRELSGERERPGQ